MKKIMVLFLAAAALHGCGRSPEALLKKGNRLHTKGDDKAAMESYNKALELKKDFPDALVARGLLYERLGDRQKAGQDYRRALEADPNFLSAYNNLGGLLMDVGNYREAVILFTRAINAKGDYPFGLLNRGLSHYKLGDCAAATRDLSEALKHYPKFEFAYYHRALCARNAGNYSAAIEDLDAVLALNPGAVLPRFERGKALYGMGKLLPAAEEFYKLTDRYPNDSAYHYWLALTFFKAGDSEGALVAAEKSLQLKPEAFLVYALVGDIHAASGNRYRAASSYEMAARYAGKYSAYYKAKARTMKTTPRAGAESR